MLVSTPFLFIYLFSRCWCFDLQNAIGAGKYIGCYLCEHLVLVTNDTNRCFLFAGLDETNRFPRFANDKKFISAEAGVGAAPGFIPTEDRGSPGGTDSAEGLCPSPWALALAVGRPQPPGAGPAPL